MGPLTHLRVLEVGDDTGAYAGKVLAELGADVLRIELPTELDRSDLNVDPDPVVQNFLHRSKRETGLAGDREHWPIALASLIAGVDLLLESGPPDLLARMGLPDDDGSLMRKDLVRTRVTPFGLVGEHSADPATDLICSASAGFLSLGGWPDRAPTRAFGDQSWRMASLHAAFGSMLALLEREASGEGQQVEVSAQEAVATALENALQYYDLEGVVRRRVGAGYNEAGSGVYRCADGFVYLMVGRLSTAQGWANLLDWFEEVGTIGAGALRLPEWSEHEFRQTPEARTRFTEVFERFSANRTKSSLYVEAQRRGIAICPINSATDLLQNEHLLARGFFVENDGAVEVGAPYRLSVTPWERGPRVLEVLR
jgi:benzylsuccinate CoA-transferase BbsE subunit